MLAGTLEIEMLANMARLSRDMDEAKRHVGNAMGSIEKAVGLAKTALGGLAAGLSVNAILAQTKSLIDAADAMNDMSQRVGVAVKDLAKYDLATAQSGTSMEALAKGIKGMAGNLEEHGDALRKAGITATTADGAIQQLADVFAAMPDGMEKTTLAVKLFGKSGMELIPMLNLGSAGLQDAAEKSAAYAQQMALLAPLADAFNDNLATLAMGGKALGLTLVNEVMPSLAQISAALAESEGTAAGFAKTLGSTLNIVLQTAAVLASDVAFVLKGLGREIGGIIAQFNALGEGGGIFSAEGRAAWVAVGDAIKEDAERARLELDRWQQQLLAGINNVQSAYNKRQGFGEAGYTDPLAQYKAILAALKDKKTAEDSAAKATKDRLAADEKAYKIHYGLVMAQIQAMNRLIDVRNKDYDSVTDYMASESLRLVETANASEAAVRAAQAEYDNHGKLQSEIEQTTLARLQDQLVNKTAGTEAYESLQRQIESQKQLIGILQRSEVRAAAETAAKDLAEANKKAAEESGRYWEDALMRAFESGKGFFESLWDTIKNTLKSQILKVLVTGTLTGLGVNTAASAASSTTSGLLTSAIGSSITNSGIASAVTSGVGAFWAGLTASGATASGAASAGLAYAGAEAAGAGGAFLGGSTVSTGLSAVPVYGWIAAAVLAVLAFAGNNRAPSSGTGEGSATFDALGNITGTDSRYQGAWGMTEQVKATVTSLQGAYALAAQALDITTMATNFAFGGNTGAEGKDPQFALGGGVVGGPTYSSGEIQYTDAAYQLAASRAVFTALQGSSLPKYLAGVFDGMTASAMSIDDINTAIAGATALKGFHDQLQQLPWPGLKDLSYAATMGLVRLAGSLENLQGSLGTFYENFYTDQQKTTDLTRTTSDAFAALGFAMPAINASSRDWYRTLVESVMAQDMSVASNQTLLNNVLSLQGAMNTLAPAFADVEAGIKDLVAGISTRVDSSIFDMQYGMEDNPGKYNMINVRATRLNDEMQASTDINAIAAMAEDQIALINQAWGLLSSEQQQAKYLEFEDRLEKIDDYVSAKGADAISLRQAENDAMATTIADALEVVMEKALAKSTAAMQAVADKAEKPIEVTSNVNLTVTDRVGVEVGIAG